MTTLIGMLCPRPYYLEYCEIYGQFSDPLMATLLEVGGELQWVWAYEGVGPDCKFLLNTPYGPKKIQKSWHIADWTALLFLMNSLFCYFLSKSVGKDTI